MRPRNAMRLWRRLALASCMAAGLSAIGCCTTGSHCGNDQCENEHCGHKRGGKHGLHEPGQEPSPNGTSVNAWFDEHETRAEADDFTIHLNEWYMGSHDLGPMGLHRLGSMIRRLHEVPFPIILAPHLDSAINEKRRQLVVQTLEQQGIGDAETRVAIAYPQAEGLYGEEGAYLYYDMFQNRSGYNSNNGFGNFSRRGGGNFGGLGFGAAGFGGLGGGGYGGGFGGFGGGFGGGGFGGYGGAGYGGGGYGNIYR